VKLHADDGIIQGWRCYDWRNSRVVLENAHLDEWRDIIEILSAFRLPHSDLTAPGKGNKSAVASAIDSKFYERRWEERKFETAITVDGVSSETPTHDIDCFRGKVALELEWNNKDPFYDRDLNNFRLLYDLRIADAGVLITRATSLQKWLKANYGLLGKAKETYGVSTTHFDKLEPRIVGGGAGGCPVFVFAMTENLYVDDR
jgi:hypothetical protein